jgi:Glycosyl hydrolases family 16
MAAVITTATTTGNANASVPPPPSGWTTVWQDDFNGKQNTLPSGNNWIIDTGTSYPGGPANWGTGEIETYTKHTQNLALDGSGNLQITPIRDGAGRWTSARIETKRSDFKPPSGGILRIQSRIQMPDLTGDAALGYWPAFWALGSPYRGNYWNWPSVGEFDIMEGVNGINAVWGALHCGVNPGGPCHETDGLVNSTSCPGSTCQSAFHTYMLEWDASVSPNVFRWSVDGNQYHSVSQTQIPEPYWSQMTSHAGYFVLLNVAIGGAFPNKQSGTTTATSTTVSGRPMKVDYVTVYSRN